jgi:hypothetical protein
VPLFLRKVRQSRWFPVKGPVWFPEHDVQADPLGDITTSGNTLSVYQIEDDKSNLERVVAAMAANNQTLSNFDYLLFNRDSLRALDIDYKQTKGATPDAGVNEWHRDIIRLSGLKLVNLAREMLHNGEKGRISEKNVSQLIAKSLAKGELDQAKVKLSKESLAKINRIVETEFAEQADDTSPSSKQIKLTYYIKRLLSRFSK